MIRIFHKLAASAAAFALAVSVSSLATAQEEPAVELEGPAFITSIGRSLDAFQVQVAFTRSGVEHVYEQDGTAEILAGEKALILVVGASVKGFGEAGISIEDEIGRVNDFVARAEEAGMHVVTVHSGGAQRRDALTDQLLEVAIPQSDLVIMMSNSDRDGRMAELAEAAEIPVFVLEGNPVGSMPPLLQELFLQ